LPEPVVPAIRTWGMRARSAKIGSRAGDVVGQADDARGLDAGRRLEFVEGDHRSGANLDDLAFDAEVLEHAFEHAGVLFQCLVREFRRLGQSLGLGQQRQRRQFEPVGAAEAEARLRVLPDLLALLDWLGVAVDARGCFLFVFLFDVLDVVFGLVVAVLLHAGLDLRIGIEDRTSVVAGEFGFDALAGAVAAAPWHGRARRQAGENVATLLILGGQAAFAPVGPARLPFGIEAPGRADHAGHGHAAPLAGHRRMQDRVVPAIAHGAQGEIAKGGYHESAGNGLGDGAAHGEGQHDHDEAVDHVSGVSPEAGGQRPAGRCRQGRERGAGAEAGEEPREDRTDRADHALMAHEAHGPGHRDGHQGQHAQAEELHELIGEDRTGITQPVGSGAVDGIVERRVVGRPGGQRHARADQHGEDREAHHFVEPLLEEDPDRVGYGAVVGVVGWIVCHGRLRRVERRRHRL